MRDRLQRRSHRVRRGTVTAVAVAALVLAAVVPAGATDGVVDTAERTEIPAPGTGLYDPFSADAAVQRAYLGLLGRTADAAGYRYWTAAIAGGLPFRSFVGHLTTTNEFRAYWPTLQRSELVATAYGRILGRTPDPDAERFWSARLSAGMSTIDFLSTLVSSDEFTVLNRYTAPEGYESISSVLYGTGAVTLDVAWDQPVVVYVAAICDSEDTCPAHDAGYAFTGFGPTGAELFDRSLPTYGMMLLPEAGEADRLRITPPSSGNGQWRVHVDPVAGAQRVPLPRGPGASGFFLSAPSVYHLPTDRDLRVGLSAKADAPFRVEALDADLTVLAVLMDTDVSRSEAVTIPAGTRTLVVTGTGFGDIVLIHG